MKKIVKVLFITILAISSCKEDKQKKETRLTYQCPMQCEGDKTYSSKGTCPVCKMDLQLFAADQTPIKESGEYSDASIFNLTTKWKTEENSTIELKDLKGKTLVMVMIYTSCKAACPRLVADMRNIEKKIPKQINNKVQYVLISIDPKTDTPDRLKAFAIENQMDGNQWTFLQGNLNSVREFANVLAVKYKQISPMDFSHSNIISVFSPLGDLIHQQEGLGVDNKETISKIIETTSKNFNTHN